MQYTENGMPKKNPLSAQIDLSKFSTEDFALATDEEKAQQEVMGESVTFFKDGCRRLSKNKLAMASLIVLVLLLISILVLPAFIPYSYSGINTVGGKRDKTATNMAPFTYSKMEQQYMEQTGEKLFPHVMGTDSLGRDYFVRVIYGTRVSLAVGLVASIMVLNERLGAVIDGVPALKLIGSNMIALFLVFGLLYWVGMARLVRGQILGIKQNEYVLAARTIGTPGGRILRKHILPNCLSVIIITTALQIPSAIFTESYLSFLGLGVKAPMPSLGSLANEAREGLTSYPYKLVFPALVICIIVLAFNLLGDGLRDAFDPKLKR